MRRGEGIFVADNSVPKCDLEPQLGACLPRVSYNIDIERAGLYYTHLRVADREGQSG